MHKGTVELGAISIPTPMFIYQLVILFVKYIMQNLYDAIFLSQELHIRNSNNHISSVMPQQVFQTNLIANASNEK